MNPAPQTSILGVLSGTDAVKIDIGLDYTTIGLLCGGLFLAILGALVISKRI